MTDAMKAQPASMVAVDREMLEDIADLLSNSMFAFISTGERASARGSQIDALLRDTPKAQTTASAEVAKALETTSDEDICRLAEAFGANIERSADPKFLHSIEISPPELRALLVAQPPTHDVSSSVTDAMASAANRILAHTRPGRPGIPDFTIKLALFAAIDAAATAFEKEQAGAAAEAPPAAISDLRYRPNEFDDWGMIRNSDGSMFASVRRPASEEELAAHRKAGTDPYKDLARRLMASYLSPQTILPQSKLVGIITEAVTALRGHGCHFSLANDLESVAAVLAVPSPQTNVDGINEALADSQYLAGVKAGFNAAQADDPNAELESLFKSRAGYLAPIRAAKDSPVSSLSGWQDMATAPKDGTVILLCGGAYGGHPFSGKWDLGPFEDTDRPWLNVITNSRLYGHVPNMWMEIPTPALSTTEIPEGDPARAPLSGPHSAGTLGARTL